MMKLNEKILNQLRYGKSSSGRVGCKVSATGDNKNNHAWISIQMIKGADLSTEIIKEWFIAYEVEYIELDEKYNEEEYGMDVDLLLLRKEHFYNIKNVGELERTLRKWIDDFSIIEPISNVGHPIY